MACMRAISRFSKSFTDSMPRAVWLTIDMITAMPFLARWASSPISRLRRSSAARRSVTSREGADHQPRPLFVADHPAPGDDPAGTRRPASGPGTRRRNRSPRRRGRPGSSRAGFAVGLVDQVLVVLEWSRWASGVRPNSRRFWSDQVSVSDRRSSFPQGPGPSPRRPPPRGGACSSSSSAVLWRSVMSVCSPSQRVEPSGRKRGEDAIRCQRTSPSARRMAISISKGWRAAKAVCSPPGTARRAPAGSCRRAPGLSASTASAGIPFSVWQLGPT